MNMPDQMKMLANNDGDFQQAKAILKSLRGGGKLFQQGAVNDGDSYSVYNHMVSLIKYLIERKPLKAYDEFEQISLILKNELKFESPNMFYDMKEFDPRTDKRSSDLKTINYENAKRELQLFTHPEHKWNENPDLESDEITLFNPNLENCPYDAYVQSFGELNLTENVPIGLTKNEIFRVWLALRLLAMKLDSKSKVKFWGKILCLDGAYYIAEKNSGEDGNGEVEAPWDDWKIGEGEETVPEEQTRPIKKKAFVYPMEEPGRGCNSWDYYITKDLNGDLWQKLPPVTPDQITASREMKLFMTGNPYATMKKEYGFNGLEAHYLRAIISRIGHGSFIAPKGFYSGENEEEEQADLPMENEDYEGMEIAELLDRSNWVHIRAMILDMGRTEWSSTGTGQPGDEADYNEDEEEEIDEEEMVRQGPNIFGNIIDDKSVSIRNPKQETFSAWRLQISSKLLPSTDVMVINKSNNWDDTYTLAKKSMVLSVYHGWGLKRTENDFTFKLLNQVSNEYDADEANAFKVVEALDPTPLEEAEYAARNKTPTEISEESAQEDEEGEEEVEEDES